MKLHIETHIDVFSCEVCNRDHKTRDSLRSHIISKHKEPREVKYLKEEAVEESDSNISKVSQISNIESVDIDVKLRNEILNRVKRVYDTDEGTMWKCTVCEKMLKEKYKLERHVETHIEGFSRRCVLCDKICKTRNALSAHISIFHRKKNK